MRFGFGLDLRARTHAAAPALWSPADEIAGGVYVWEASALAEPATPGGVTTLSDANGGPVTLTARDAVAGSQPAWTADAGDGMPALVFTADTAAQRLVYVGTLSLEAASLFYLLRPDAGGATVAHSVLSLGSTGAGSFQVQAGTAGEFRATINATAPMPTLTASPATNRAGQWIAGVIELDPAGGQARHWINGAQVASAAFAPSGPVAHPRLAIAANRGLNQSSPMSFAHGFLLHKVGAETRAQGAAYLKRIWGSRVQGWA